MVSVFYFIFFALLLDNFTLSSFGTFDFLSAFIIYVEESTVTLFSVIFLWILLRFFSLFLVVNCLTIVFLKVFLNLVFFVLLCLEFTEFLEFVSHYLLRVLENSPPLALQGELQPHFSPLKEPQLHVC